MRATCREAAGGEEGTAAPFSEESVAGFADRDTRAIPSDTEIHRCDVEDEWSRFCRIQG